MTPQLIVLGSGNWRPSSKRHPPSFLLRLGKDLLLLDCGYGAIHRLCDFSIKVEQLTKIMITHHHGDHISDLAPILHCWTLLTKDDAHRTLMVFGPPGLQSRISQTYRLFCCEDLHDERIKVIECDSSTSEFPFDWGYIEPFPVDHIPDTVCLGYAVKWGGRKFVYTGDLAPTDQTPQFFEKIQGADLLLIEAGDGNGKSQSHLTPAHACALAQVAGAKNTLLFHVSEDDLTQARSIADRYNRPNAKFDVTHDLQVIDI